MKKNSDSCIVALLRFNNCPYDVWIIVLSYYFVLQKVAVQYKYCVGDAESVKVKK